MSLQARLLLITVVIGLAIAMLPFLRTAIAKIFGPVVMEGFKMSVFSFIWVSKTLWRDHWLVLKSLVTPRRILFPSLSETLRAEEDEARGRK